MVLAVSGTHAGAMTILLGELEHTHSTNRKTTLTLYIHVHIYILYILGVPQPSRLWHTELMAQWLMLLLLLELDNFRLLSLFDDFIREEYPVLAKFWFYYS